MSHKKCEMRQSKFSDFKTTKFLIWYIIPLKTKYCLSAATLTFWGEKKKGSLEETVSGTRKYEFLIFPIDLKKELKKKKEFKTVDR